MTTQTPELEQTWREFFDEFLVPNNGNHPYGVELGDRVHYWSENPPPLSMDYVAPPCLPALVIGFSQGVPPWSAETKVWMADLAVVDPATEELRVIRRVPQSEGSAQVALRGGALSQRSFGVSASWHVHHAEDGR